MIAMRSWLLAIAVSILAFDAARCDFEAIAAVANQCWPSHQWLSKDRTVLCFDGQIRADQDPKLFHELKQDGLKLKPGGYRMQDMIRYVAGSKLFLEK